MAASSQRKPARAAKFCMQLEKNCIISNLMSCTPHQILIKWSNPGRWDGWGI